MQNDHVDRRLDALEARLALLEGTPVKKTTSVPIFADEGARISYPAPSTQFEQPSEMELRQLLTIAGARLKRLRQLPTFSGARAQEIEEEHFRQFAAAFRALGQMGRQEKLDKKRALSFWIGSAEQLLRDRGLSESITGPAFVAAVIAHGDIQYNDPADYPYVHEFGLCDQNIGRPSNGAWKRVLTSGQTLDPVRVGGTARPMPQPSVRIVG